MPYTRAMNTPTTSELIDIAGGTASVARFFQIASASVSEWRKMQKLPDDKLIRLAPLIETKSKIKRWDLRPNDWFLIWPELVGKKGAPKIPTNTKLHRSQKSSINAS